MKRVYLDWNATAPLRPEARAVMLAAMDCLGNPSSVHAEGRAAKAIVEKARRQVADLVGCDRDEVVFTSGATEAARIILDSASMVQVSAVEHDAVFIMQESPHGGILDVDENGLLVAEVDPRFEGWVCVQAANPETGVVQDLQSIVGLSFVDATQVAGKKVLRYSEAPVPTCISAHKFGGAKGAGALIIPESSGLETLSHGTGQEKGRRSGTENVVGIAGMGAAAEAAAKDLADGVWQIVEQNRNVFEERLLNAVPELIIFGSDVPRLPNTSYFAVKGWKAETQVMQMDLAGFAVSAGSACSSGKVKASRVLKAMGYDEITAGSAIRVSIGPSTTAAELESFAEAWLAEYKRFKARREGK